MEDYEDKEHKRYELDEPETPSLRALVELKNIADALDEDELNEIGEEAKRGYEFDLQSREHWERDLDEWMCLATQVRETKNYPWPNASNVKYPLLTTAAMQFAARAYPSLVPSDGKVVKSTVVGKDPDGSKLELASRVDTFMSYQIMHEMYGWEEDMDKLLIMLPVVGTAFKKTYWDPVCKYNVSKLVLPKNLVVNYWTECLEKSERISEWFELSPRLFEEKKRAGLYLDLELAHPASYLKEGAKDGQVSIPAGDCTVPFEFIEQHTYLDLDDDGYKEPYIVTFERYTGKVFRICARFDDTTMEFNADGDLLKIEPIQYYTKFGFIPNPDGSFYDIGFGMLLGPVNESVNTLINQLIDAGTLSNMQSGFLGKGLRLRAGEYRFQPGEWKPVNATGDDLRKQIVPLPAKDPSNVLFQLMGSLITSGKELASVAEIFTGKMPGQNTPATTTMATVEQGMKVFTAVYKRIYRALAEEFKKLFDLNGTYLNPETYQAVTGVEVGPEDFKPMGPKGEYYYRICPGADPTAVSQSEKLMKAQALMEMIPLGTLDPVEVTRRLLDAMEQPNAEKCLNPAIQQTGQMPPPPPDPKMMEMQMKMNMEQSSAATKTQAMQAKMELDARSEEQQMAMKREAHQQEMQMKQQTAVMDAQANMHKQRIFMVQEAQKTQQQAAQGQQDLAHREQTHQQNLKQGAEQSQAKTAQMKQQAAAKPKPKK